MRVEIQLLAVMVRDLGYSVDAPPVYGHHPLRHQFAWGILEGAFGDQLDAEVKKLQASATAENEVPLVRR
jgi:hypothetical protein